MRTLLLAVLVGAAAPLSAQSIRTDPEALALEATRMGTEGDWSGLAQVIDPAQLTRVHSAFARLFALQPDPQSFALFGVQDLAGFNALDPRVVVATMMELADESVPVEIGDTRILGIIREGDLAHVVVRQTGRIMNADFSGAELMTLRDADEEGWWLVMGPEFEGMLIGIESQLPQIQE